MGFEAPAPSPDDLLQQIRDLLDQYLAAGGQTPVAAEAQSLADAIDQTMGGGEGELGSPMPAGGEMLDSEGEPPMGLDDLEEPPPNQEAKTYGAANKTALDRLQRRNKKTRA